MTAGWKFPQGTGGAAIVNDPAAAPASPSAHDDEFVDASLGGAWTTVLNPTASGFVITPDKYGSWFALEGPGAASNAEGRWRRSLAGDGDAGVQFAATARLAVASPGSGAVAIYLGLGDNTDLSAGSRLQGGVTYNAANQQISLVQDGSAAVNDVQGAGAAEVWVHFQRTTGNIASWWHSRDGRSWLRRYSTSRTENWTYLWVQIVGGGASHPFQAMCDFVRVNSLWLPV